MKRFESSPSLVSADWTAGSEVVELNNGQKILIGGLTRSHRQRHLTALDSLSSRTLCWRFFSPITEINDAQADSFLDVGRYGREALIAVSFDTRSLGFMGAPSGSGKLVMIMQSRTTTPPSPRERSRR